MKTFEKYHKINGLYKRWTKDNCDNLKLYGQFIHGSFSTPEFDMLFNAQWVWTEKIDGTNIRIGWDGTEVRIGGRTNNAQLHIDLLKRLQELFTIEKLSEVFGIGEQETYLFGEGYGAGIQKGGGDYVENHTVKDFILFDVKINGMYLERGNLKDVGAQLEVFWVPRWVGPESLSYASRIGTATIQEAIDFVKTEPTSWLAQSVGKVKVMEGLVGTPINGLLDRRGNRIITKIKVVDFKDDE